MNIDSLFFKDDEFNHGWCEFKTGLNAGIRRQIKDTVPNPPTGVTFEFHSTFPFQPTVNDEIEIQTGCDKTRTACSARFFLRNNTPILFNNLDRHGGFLGIADKWRAKVFYLKS